MTSHWQQKVHVRSSPLRSNTVYTVPECKQQSSYCLYFACRNTGFIHMIISIWKIFCIILWLFLFSSFLFFYHFLFLSLIFFLHFFHSWCLCYFFISLFILLVFPSTFLSPSLSLFIIHILYSYLLFIFLLFLSFMILRRGIETGIIFKTATFYDVSPCSLDEVDTWRRQCASQKRSLPRDYTALYLGMM